MTRKKYPPGITTKVAKSIELLATVKAPGSWLSRDQYKFLLTGGLDWYKEHKPHLAKEIEEMLQRRGPFPFDFYKLADYINDRILSEKVKINPVLPIETEAVIRFKRDPFLSSSPKIYFIADSIYKYCKEQLEKGNKDFEIAEQIIGKYLEWMKLNIERTKGDVNVMEELK
ncbi:hypothetical protein [Desulfurobacterium sp. TC5-1]|uniref:hypothetical protein n=1 Tax=Desulfurobacterium sp. TC5-1 TaxID=1158318 RepID=UPI0003B682A7|nr:hypothetical protein [Desulfurobacterium sp. TC5-1]